MADRVGQRLDDYLLIRWLGGGSFGDVYLAEHLFEKKLAAIKVLKVQLTPETMKSFLREARTIRLHHPHIVPLLDFGLDEQTPFLVMEYAPNGTLRQRHPSGAILAPATLLPYVQQVASALHYAHERRLIHRDVKPQNMLLGASHEVLLSDFGIATMAHSEASFTASEMVGTLPYMAPEQIRGKPSPASDQYALGVVVYEWLCGERPFQGAQWEILAQHVQASPPPLRQKQPSIPAAAEAVVLRALAKEPQQRFADVQSFAQALHHAFNIPFQSHNAHPQISSSASSVDLDQTDGRLPALRLASVPPTLPQLTPAQVMPLAPTQPTPGLPASMLSTTPLPDAPVRPPIRKQSLSRGYAALLLTLVALLMVSGGYTLSTYWAQRSTSLSQEATATVRALPTVRAGATARAVMDTYNGAVTQHGIMFGFDAQHTGNNPYEQFLNASTVSQLEKRWAMPADTAGDGLISSTPAVVNGVVYVGSEDHRLYAFDALTGQQKWMNATEAPIYTAPAASNGLVYVGSDDGRLYAFDAATGREKWVDATQDGIDSSPVVADGVVYVGSDDGHVYAFNINGGILKWYTNIGGRSQLLFSSPAIANGLVYIGSADGNLYALDATNGQPKWAVPTGCVGFASPAVANGLVYIGSRKDHKLHVFDATTGQTKWTAATIGEIDGSPAIANGLVYIGSSNFPGSSDKSQTLLYAFDATTGQQKWTSTIGPYVGTDPIVANGLVYIGSEDGNLYAFDAFTGQRKWIEALGDRVTSSPSIANGWVYVGAHDQKLHAFALPANTQ